jgi:hypothetical protein
MINLGLYSCSGCFLSCLASKGLVVLCVIWVSYSN